MKKFSLALFVGLAVVTIPVFLTGESAEEAVEHLPGVTEALVEAHEEAAKVAMILTQIVGIGSLVALFLRRNAVVQRLLPKGVAILAVVASGALFYASKLGGEVRHTEIRTGSDAALGAGFEATGEEVVPEDQVAPVEDELKQMEDELTEEGEE